MLSSFVLRPKLRTRMRGRSGKQKSLQSKQGSLGVRRSVAMSSIWTLHIGQSDTFSLTRLIPHHSVYHHPIKWIHTTGRLEITVRAVSSGPKSPHNKKSMSWTRPLSSTPWTISCKRLTVDPHAIFRPPCNNQMKPSNKKNRFQQGNLKPTKRSSSSL